MLIRCSNCKFTLEKVNDETNISTGWYRDNLGNHTIIVCKKCFTIHDVVGTLNIIAAIFGGSSFKVINAINPQGINKTLSEIASNAEESDLKIGVPKSMAEAYYTMPFAILKEKLGMQESVIRFLFENGVINDPIKRL